MAPWTLCGVLLAAVIGLGIRLLLIQRDLEELRRQLQDRLSDDTNTLLTTSSGGALRRLTAALNGQLRQLRRQRQQYLRGDRELKEAVTAVSHDLRTPLTAIQGYLELLEREDKSPDAERYLARIDERVQAMTRLTGELFRSSALLSSREELPVETVDLRGALEESLASFYGAFTAGRLQPEVSIPEKPVLCRVNRAALSRVLDNILSNALKYSDGDLSVFLTGDGELLFSNAASRLSRAQVEQLFDRCFSVKTAEQGAGLGLSIAKSLTGQMGGQLTAEYRAGRLCIRVQLLKEEGM